MAYIGNEPGVGTFIVSTERFNGTGACTQFTITQTGIDDANAIDVIVNSVTQDPINSYSITDGVITFTEAPSSGTQNIIVRYRATSVITFSSITTSQILDGQITASKIASGVLPSAAANSAGVYANAAFATANTGTASGSYANSAFATANTGSASGSYANSAFASANLISGVNTTQNTNITSASSYANSGFSVANSAASYANSGFAKANSSVSLTANVSGTLPVGNGGTGASTLTVNNVILGNTTSAVKFVAPGTTGNLLTSDGTTWTSAAASGGVTSLNGQTGAITNTDIDSIGSICHVAYGGTSQIAVGSTVAGSSLYRASSATDQATSTGTFWSQGTSAGGRPKTAWGNTVGTGVGVAIQETTGIVGWQAPGGATTMSGTWRLLSPVAGRASETITPCCVNTTRSRSWCCIAVRVS